MTIADSRVVGWVAQSIHGGSIGTDIVPANWTTTDERLAALNNKPWVLAGKSAVIGLVPLALLAEAESALKDAQESEDIEYALRVKAESRIAALQSRLDAVVGLADGLAQRGCDMQARVDQSFAEEAEHTYYHGYTNVISESADAIRSAALGGESPGNDEVRK